MPEKAKFSAAHIVRIEFYIVNELLMLNSIQHTFLLIFSFTLSFIFHVWALIFNINVIFSHVIAYSFYIRTILLSFQPQLRFLQLVFPITFNLIGTGTQIFSVLYPCYQSVDSRVPFPHSSLAICSEAFLLILLDRASSW